MRGRLVARDVADRTVLSKLFDSIAPRFAERPGGYTRLLRSGRRQGDDAPLAQVELVGSEYTPETETAQAAEEETEGGVTGRVPPGRATDPGRFGGHVRQPAGQGPCQASGIDSYSPSSSFPVASPRSAFASAITFPCRCAGTSS